MDIPKLSTAGETSHHFLFNKAQLLQQQSSASNMLPERIFYDHTKHGDIAEFSTNEAGHELQQQFLKGIDDISTFLEQNRAQPLPESQLLLQRSNLNEFKARLTQGGSPGSFFSSHYALIASQGKYDFDRILAAIHNREVKPDQIYDVVNRLPTEITACSTGTITNLHDIAGQIHAAVGDFQDTMKQSYKEHAEAVILQFAQNQHAHEPNYVGNEIHYVNGYRNRLADRFALEALFDDFIPPTVDHADNVERCAEKLQTMMSASRFVDQLSDAYMDHVKCIFPERLRFSPDDLNSDQFTIMRTQLDRRFGIVNPHDIFEEKEPEGSYGLREDRTLLKRAIAHNLRQIGVLLPFKSEKIAGDKQSGTVAKALSTLLYLKEYSGTARVERRPLQSTDLDEKWLISSGASALLFPAARLGKLKAVQELLAPPTDVNAKDALGLTALLYAAQNGHKDIAKVLVEAKANVDAKDPADLTSLMHAVHKGHRDVVEVLVDAKADVNAQDPAGLTPLMHAIENGHIDIAQILIAGKANVHARDPFGSTTLMQAAMGGHKDIAELLVAERADVNAQDSFGFTALMYAAENGYEGVVDLLVTAKADVNARDPSKISALMLAAAYGHKNVVKALLDAQAEVNAEDDSGSTALVIASQFARQDVVQALLDGNAAVDAPNALGFTALIIAAQDGHKNVVDALLQAHANVNATNVVGTTGLMLAAQEGHKDVIDTLIEAQADVNAQNADGLTGLMLAAQNGHIESVRALLAAGANIDAEDLEGRNARSFAASKDRQDVIELLDATKARFS